MSNSGLRRNTNRKTNATGPTPNVLLLAKNRHVRATTDFTRHVFKYIIIISTNLVVLRRL